MRSKGLSRLLAILLCVMTTVNMAPSMVFAGQSGNDSQGTVTEQAAEDADSAEAGQKDNSGSAGEGQGADADDQSQASGGNEVSVNSSDAEQDGGAVTVTPESDNDADGGETVQGESTPEIIDDAAAKTDEEKNADAEVKIKAKSLTNNIVGDVFSNMLNAGDDEEAAAAREAALEQYPLENHEYSYYEGSIRLRELQSGGDAESPNYVVYRDEYLIFSEKESSEYKVESSEDGSTAFVTPAIPEEDLQGKIGVVFLGENVGYDNILVFGGTPAYEGDTMEIPLKPTEEIMVSELFSDGKLIPEQPKRRLMKAGLGPISWETNPEGTNWKAEITDFSTDWPTPGFRMDIWELLFEVQLELYANLDFKIKSTGATGGRETVKIAGFKIPIELFTVGMEYDLQVEFFDDTPVEVEGTLETSFAYGFGTHGATISNYHTNLDIDSLTVDPDGTLGADAYNKDIDFYIGSKLESAGSFIEVDLDLWLFEITIGPVLKLAQDFRGGCYVTANHEKDQYSPPPDESLNEIHTCTPNGEEGCLSLKVREVHQTKLTISLDLYFDSWDWDLSDSGEKEDRTTDYYNSYTFQSGVKEGTCPHRFYKVPVRVWLNEEQTVPAPAGMNVTVSDSLDVHESEKDLISSVTDSQGKATLFLPYKDKYCYTCVATGTIGGKSVAGSKQTIYIRRDENPTVHIVLKSDEKVKVKADIVWNVDVDEKDVSSERDTLRPMLFRRAAGSDDEWVEVRGDDNFEAMHSTDKASGWKVEEWEVPKFGFNSSGPYLYEYRVRLFELYPDSFSDRVITPENNNCYIRRYVAAYDNAAGVPEQSHTTRYHIDYDDTSTDEVTETTITATAVMTVKVNKKWNLTDPENKPDFVYLAMTQKPETGWEDKAAEKRVPDAWIPTLNPLSGNSSTLKELERVEVGEERLLSTMDYIGTVENTPLTIGKVSAENDWVLTYTVPKYRNGIQLRYEGMELDDSVIEDLLKYEYDIVTNAAVASFGNYVSVAGLAVNEDDTTMSANVINMDPLPDNTIMGTVRWESDSFGSWWSDVPDEVKLDIYNNGGKIDEITLNKNDYKQQDTWIWTKTLGEDVYDPDAEYTVKETFPDGSQEWVGVVTDLDVYNYRTWYESLQCEAQAVFDYEPDRDDINVTINEKGSSDSTWKFNLEKRDDWWDRNADKKKDEVKDISEYEMKAPEIPGYVRVYGEPYSYTRPGWGNVFYNFTVYYMKQSDHLKLHITKEWENTDEATEYPDEVFVKVYRDSELIAEESIEKKVLSQKWDEVVITEDADGNDLKRVDEDGHKYIYTIVETPVEGFTSKLTKTKDDGGDDIYYTLENTWAGADAVNVKGTVKWEGDEGKEHLRPETVSLSVIDSNENYVKTIKVKTDKNGNYEAKFLPAKDDEGNPLSYSVLESHVKGYTSSYSDPVFDEKTRTWTCDVTNTLTGYFTMKLKKTIDGDEPEEKETYKFDIQPKTYNDSKNDRETPVPLNSDKLSIEGAGEVTVEFLFDEDGLYLYSAKEIAGENDKCVYDDTEKQILISKSYDKETGKSKFKSWVKDVEKEDDSSSDDDQDDADNQNNDSDNQNNDSDNQNNDSDDELATDDSELIGHESDTIEFVNKYPTVINIEKKWDIDLAKQDRPDSIEVVIQEKKGDKWEDFKEVELSGDNDWKAKVVIEEAEADSEGDDNSGNDSDQAGKKGSDEKGDSDDENKKREFRVRELTEKAALEELSDKIKEMITGQESVAFDSVLEQIKGYGGGKYYDALPQSVKDAAAQGEDKLREELKATTENLYDKLLEKMGLSSDRIVYDEDDDDKDEDAKTNEVTYHVDGFTAEALTSEGAHITKYRVKYEEDDGNWTITNQAILEIVNIKRWLSLGVDDDDMPESAWIVLMFKPSAGALDKASSLGLDIGDVLDYEFPVINPIEGGRDPISVISELITGVDIDIFSKFIPLKLAIEKVEGKDEDEEDGGDDEDDESEDWRTRYVVSKYYLGVPMEYKGAELSSEVIRQIVKYATSGVVDLPVSYNPFDNYISIPTKAIPTIAGIEDPEDFLDFSGLAGKMLEKAKSLTMDDIKNFGPQTLLDPWRLMANVINLKFDWSSEKTINGYKIWKDEEAGDDREDKRPESIKIHILKDGEELEEGSPVELKKEDFKGKDEWKWDSEIETEDDVEYTITEEYPENYEYKDNYVSEINGYDITNKWVENKPGTTTVSGKKIWKDENDIDKIRPEKVRVRLLADGEPAKYADDKDSDEGSGDGNADNGDNIGQNADGEGAQDDGITADITKQCGWTWTFTNLPKYKNGAETGSKDDEIKYSVEEIEVPKGYTPEYDEKSGNITNTHTPAKISVEVTKVWEYNENDAGKRPKSVTIRLKADGKEVESKEISESDDWKWTFKNLPKKSEGKKITYTITEDTVTDYTTEIKNDSDSDDGNASGGEGNGAPAVDGDNTPADGGDDQNDDNGVISFTVTNTYNPGMTQVNVTKVWNDEDNQDGIRPESVNVVLYSYSEKDDEYQAAPVMDENDKPVSLDLSEDNDWTGTFKELPTTKVPEGGGESEAINYVVKEAKSDDGVISDKDGEKTYASEVTGNMEEGFTVTNTHTPATITITGEKVWDDDEDRDKLRPGRISVCLCDTGVEIKRVLVSAGDDWKWEFEDLPKYVEGEEIKYTVKEVDIDGYEAEVEGSVEDGFTITNKHTPETVKLTGEKVWDDNSDQDGKRPDSITIKVKANGEEVEDAKIELSKDDFEGKDTWNWEVELPKNEDGKEIEYTVEEDPVDGYEDPVIEGNAEDGFTITNKHTPELIDIDVDKVWEDNDDQDGKRPESVTLHLYTGEGEDRKEAGKATISDSEDWTWTFKEMPKYADGKEIKYSVKEDEITDYIAKVTGDTSEGFKVTNTYTPLMISVKGTKVWEDAEDQDGKRPESITIRLQADGKEARTVTVTEEDNWKWSFDDLPQCLEGEEITYTITEDTVTDYTSEISGDAEQGFTVTNTYTPGKTQVSVTKAWEDEDDLDKIRPTSVTVKLLANGRDTAKMVTLSEVNNWQGTFSDLDVMKNGEEVEYTVEENLTDVITGTDGVGTYAVEVSGNAAEGFTVTNSHRPEKITIKGKKVWDDNDDQDGKRPESIKIRLKADGKEVKVKTVSADNNWKWQFGMPKYEGNREIVYTLTEDAVTDYTTVVEGDADEGFTVTNKYKPGYTQINVTKKWKDENDQDGIRPESVDVILLANGTVVTEKMMTLSEENNWTAAFTNLNVMHEGKAITYSIEETMTPVINGTDAEGTYSMEVTGNPQKGFTITNTHTPTTVKFDVSLVWDDNDDQDGIRPDTSTVDLYYYTGDDPSDAQPYTDPENKPVTVELTRDNGWKGEFAGLPSNKDGKKINYIVKEEKTDVITGMDEPGHYAYEVTGDSGSGFVVTNTHTPEVITLDGSKTWDDKDDQDGERPESIMIRLRANGEVFDEKIVTEADGWAWTFAGVPKNKAGKEIDYTITEDAVDDYTSEIDGMDATNTHTPRKTQVTVVKVWDDENDLEKIRPNSVKVELIADGEKTGKTITLSEGNHWTDSFINLDERKAGKDITYTVEEQKSNVITGKDARGTYAFEITGDQKTGYTITNTHTPIQYTITYKLNGGTYKGSPADIKEVYRYGTVILIHPKPVRKGYKFLYWKGSEYQPGDRYTVTDDHTFVAQWKKVPDESTTRTDDGNRVKTGDDNNIMLWITLMSISLLGLIALLVVYRKRHN